MRREGVEGRSGEKGTKTGPRAARPGWSARLERAPRPAGGGAARGCGSVPAGVGGRRRRALAGAGGARGRAARGAGGRRRAAERGSAPTLSAPSWPARARRGAGGRLSVHPRLA